MVDSAEIRPGREAMYRGTWAYIVLVDTVDQKVWLSGWRGIKTTVADIRDIQNVRDQKQGRAAR